MKVLVTFQKVISFAISRSVHMNIESSRFRKVLRILKHFVFCGWLCLALILISVHLFYEAESFQEAAETFYPLLTLCTCAMYITVLISKEREIFAFIDHFEDTIDKRKIKYFRRMSPGLSLNVRALFTNINSCYRIKESGIAFDLRRSK